MEMAKNEISIFLLIGCSQKRETPEVRCQHTDHIDMLKDFIFIHRYLFGLHWLYINTFVSSAVSICHKFCLLFFSSEKKTQFFTNPFRERFLPISMEMTRNSIYISLLIGCSQKRETPKVRFQHTDHIEILKDFIFIHKYLFGLHWLNTIVSSML